MLVRPDIEVPAHDVDVGRGVPVGSGVEAVRVSEGDVDSGDLFVLQDVAADVDERKIRTNRELAGFLARKSVAPVSGAVNDSENLDSRILNAINDHIREAGDHELPGTSLMPSPAPLMKLSQASSAFVNRQRDASRNNRARLLPKVVADVGEIVCRRRRPANAHQLGYRLSISSPTSS